MANPPVALAGPIEWRVEGRRRGVWKFVQILVDVTLGVWEALRAAAAQTCPVEFGDPAVGTGRFSTTPSGSEQRKEIPVADSSV